MFKEVSTGQSFMAVVKAILVWLVCVIGGCGGCVYFVSTKVFMQADRIARDAAAAAKPGMHLRELLSEHSEFMATLTRSHLLSLDIGNRSESMSGGNGDCGSLIFHDRGQVSFQKAGNSAPRVEFKITDGGDWGGEFVEKHANVLKACTILSTNVMKNVVRHCPLLVEYDRDLRVVRATTKPCWD